MRFPSKPQAPTSAESRETIGLAFVAALQRLPPRQTAAVVLCDVLGFSTAEVADMMTVTPTVIKGLLQRERTALATDRPESLAPASERGSPVERRTAQRFAEAFADDDIEGVVSLLTDDAWLAMPPARHEYQGANAIAFLIASVTWRPARKFNLVPTMANRQPAFLCYLHGEFAGVLVLDVKSDRISAITHFLDSTPSSLIKAIEARGADR